MGSKMAANLIKAGLPVLVFDRNPAAVEQLLKLGAKSASSPKEIAETPGVVTWLAGWPTAAVIFLKIVECSSETSN